MSRPLLVMKPGLVTRARQASDALAQVSAYLALIAESHSGASSDLSDAQEAVEDLIADIAALEPD